MTKTPAKSPVLPTAKQVRAFLTENPGFLAANPDLLPHLVPPAEQHTGKVADFQHFMLRKLQEKHQDMHAYHSELMENARANSGHLVRIHASVLALLDSDSPQSFFAALTETLPALLDMDIITVMLETGGKKIPTSNLPGLMLVDPGTVDHLMGSNESLLADNIIGDARLYGAGAGLVKSQALVRLANQPPALLAFGSRDPGMFTPEQAVDLLVFLGAVTGRGLAAWL